MTRRGPAAYNDRRDFAWTEKLLRRQAIRYARLAAGASLILFGVLGGFIPILQGWVFVLAGLTLMAPESRRARCILDWAKSKVGAAKPLARPAGREPLGGCEPGEKRN